MATLPRKNIPAAIENREEFKGSSIHGRPVANVPHTGRMSDEWAAKMAEQKPTYVVFSYGTPIAWIAENGMPVVPDTKYSVTTSAHQSLAALGLLGLGSARSSLH